MKRVKASCRAISYGYVVTLLDGQGTTDQEDALGTHMAKDNDYKKADFISYEMLLSYVDGELSKEEAQQVRELIERDTKIKARVTSIVELKKMVQLAYEEI